MENHQQMKFFSKHNSRKEGKPQPRVCSKGLQWAWRLMKLGFCGQLWARRDCNTGISGRMQVDRGAAKARAEELCKQVRKAEGVHEQARLGPLCAQGLIL